MTKKRRVSKKNQPDVTIKREHGDHVRCDECGEPAGTLYMHEGGLVCFSELPFGVKYGRSHVKAMRRAVSGERAIKARRRAMQRAALQH